jgi:thioredoxin-like negative regulator of GroEL
MTVLNRFAYVALAAGAMSAAAQAQAPAKCDIDENKPNQVKDARNALVTGGLIAKPEDKAKKLASAVKLLTDQPEKIGNPVGRNWVLGRTLITLATLPGGSSSAKRGAVGYSTDPEGTIDLVLAADSAFAEVEKAMPQCTKDTEEYRRLAYSGIINNAVTLYNSQQIDSAAALAKRGVMIYPSYPLSYIGYNVLANAAQSKQDFKGAIANYKKMVSVIGTDTAYQDEKRTARLAIGALAADVADRSEGAEKQAMAKDAVEAYSDFLKENPGDCNAQSGLARAQLTSGDSASANKSYASILTNAGKCTDYQLFEAGVSAARAERTKEAIQFFEAGLQKNPYSRDGLFNLAVTYSSAEQWDKIPGIITRLNEVDPENPDNYRVLAQYYQARAKSAKDAAAKKPATDPAVKTYQALNDSLLKAFTRYNDAPVKVTFNLFSQTGQKRVLAGNVENRATEAKSYTLKFDFIDGAGKVVTSKEAAVGPIDPKATKPFRIEAEGTGIVAFKYAPLSR